MGGIFGNMFDFNRDGKLDSFERTMEFGFIQSLDKEVSGEIYDEDNEDLTELEEAGLDPEELEFMDDDERREILEAAGLGPDEFDF